VKIRRGGRARLGVTRSRLARQLLTEAVLLSGVGALAGLVPAWAVVRVVAASGPAELPRLETLALDGRAVGVALLLALGSAVVFGLVPRRHRGRRAATHHHRGAGRSGGAAMWRTRAAIVAANVAMAAVLLATSAVLAQSILRLLAVEPGVRTANVLTMTLWAGGERFREGDTPRQIRTAVAFYDDVLSRVRALPGVEAAAATTVLPLSRNIDGIGFHIVGRLTANPADAPVADRFAVTGDYFRALDLPVLRGRLLDDGDGIGAAPVAVINRTAAETLFDGDDPLGQQVILGGPGGQPRTVVGIVGDVRHRGLDRPVGPQVYVPQAQWAWPETYMTLVVRTSGPPTALAAAVRGAVREVDPAQPVTDVRAFDEVLAGTTASRRFVASALGAFAAAALLLAAVGLYGALSVSVAQRRLEIGIRLALGAHAGAIRRMVFANGMRPVIAGLGLGLVGGLVVLRMLGGLLFDVRPVGLAALAGAAGLLLDRRRRLCRAGVARLALDTAGALRAE
jgi:putative ABC transport system permease protein